MYYLLKFYYPEYQRWIIFVEINKLSYKLSKELMILFPLLSILSNLKIGTMYFIKIKLGFDSCLFINHIQSFLNLKQQ